MELFPNSQIFNYMNFILETKNILEVFFWIILHKNKNKNLFDHMSFNIFFSIQTFKNRKEKKLNQPHHLLPIDISLEKNCDCST